MRGVPRRASQGGGPSEAPFTSAIALRERRQVHDAELGRLRAGDGSQGKASRAKNLPVSGTRVLRPRQHEGVPGGRRRRRLGGFSRLSAEDALRRNEAVT